MPPSVIPQFPEFLQPTFVRPVTDTLPDVPYPKGFGFDFATGQVLVDGQGHPIELAGHPAAAQWAAFCVLVERFAYAAIPPRAGIEARPALAQPNDPARRVALEAAIRAAILQVGDKRIAKVDEFSFTPRGDGTEVTFHIEFTSAPSRDLELYMTPIEIVVVF